MQHPEIPWCKKGSFSQTAFLKKYVSGYALAWAATAAMALSTSSGLPRYF